MKNTYTKGILLVLSTALISGFAIFINSWGVKEFDSSVFTALKSFVVAALLLLTILLCQKGVFLTLKLKDWLKLVLIGFVGGSIPFLLFFQGLKMTSGVQGSFIHKTMFIFVFVPAFLFLKEKVNYKLFLAGLLFLLGNVLFLRMFAFKVGIGDVLILAATILWAIENIISKHTLKSLSGTTVAFGRMFFGLIFILIFLFFTGKISLVSSFTVPQIGWILITSVILYGYVMTYYNGLKLIPVSLASSILVLGSPITTILSFIFFGKGVAILQIIGGILIFSGVAIAILWAFKNKPKKKFLEKVKI